MKNIGSAALTVVACALVVSTVSVSRLSGQDAQPPSAGTVAPADDPAVPLFTQICGKCHDATRIVATRRTRPEWQEVINKMIEKGAEGSGADFETVFGYLLRHYGEVFINSAPPEEIVLIVGLTKKDADAIVAFREAHGAFADLDALRKVPDIDLKNLDLHKESVAF